MELDEMIRKFKLYAEGKGGYDELDLKAGLIDWRQKEVSRVVDTIFSHIGKIVDRHKSNNS